MVSVPPCGGWSAAQSPATPDNTHINHPGIWVESETIMGMLWPRGPFNDLGTLHDTLVEYLENDPDQLIKVEVLAKDGKSGRSFTGQVRHVLRNFGSDSESVEVHWRDDYDQAYMFFWNQETYVPGIRLYTA